MTKKVFAGVLVVMAVAMVAMPAFAQAEHPAAAGQQSMPGGPTAYLGLALGFGLAIAAFGGAAGQSKAIAAAVEAVARQPEAGGRIQGMMIIGLALIETLVIYMLLICFMWGDKVGK